jgi:hypothetical protein
VSEPAETKSHKQTTEASRLHPAWNDPSIPAGDSPPLPRWPLVLSAVAWVAWLLFLVLMVAMRFGSQPDVTPSGLSAVASLV